MSKNFKNYDEDWYLQNQYEEDDEELDETYKDMISSSAYNSFKNSKKGTKKKEQKFKTDKQMNNYRK